MAIIGTDDNQDNELVQPTSSSSSNAHASDASAQGVPYSGASGGFAGGTGTGSGQGATTGVAAGGGGTPASPTGGGGYANLSQYLAANQGTGATTGQAAENVVQQSGDAAKQLQNTYSGEASNDIAKATAGVANNADTLASIKSGTANVDQGTLNQIASGGYSYSPTSALNNVSGASQSDLDSIIAQGKAASTLGANTYTGPTDFSKVAYGGPTIDKVQVSYGGPTTTSGFTGQTAADQAAAIQQQGVVQGNVKAAGGGQSGVAGLLKNAYQQPNYTQGENSLDAFLAGGTQGGQQALAQAGGIGTDVDNSYSGINAALQGQIASGQQTAKDTNTAYQNAIDAANQTSNATRGTYQSAVAAQQAKSAADQKAAIDAQTKAQNEENTRAAAAKAAADAAAAAAEKLKLSQTPPAPPPPPPQTNLQKAAGAVAGGLQGGASDIANAPKNAVNAPLTLGNQITGTLKGNQAATNALATTIGTGGLSVLAPKTTATAINNAKTAVGQATSAAKNVASQAVKKLTGFHFAHGGEVPSYSKLSAMLKRKSK